MGMFNWVDHRAPCRRCQYELTSKNWQTKDSVRPLWCEVVPLFEVENLYALCPQCGAWNQYTVQKHVTEVHNHGVNFGVVEVVKTIKYTLIRDEEEERRINADLDAAKKKP